MTPMAPLDTSSIWRARRWLSRLALGSATALLGVGLVMAVAGRAESTEVLSLACAILVGIPAINVLAVLAVEVRLRDWRFAGVTAVVILLLVYSVLTRVLMRN
jgi:hypothetical protein